MKPRIVRPNRVRSDLKAIARSTGRFHSGRFLAAAEAAINRLADFPFLAGAHESSDGELTDLRVWPIPDFENYLIFY